LLNNALADIAKKKNIPVLDLTDKFEESWKKDAQRFEFNGDNHWNPYAHRIVAAAVKEKLEELGWYY